MNPKEREAIRLMAKGEPLKAVEIYRQLLTEEPDDPDLFNEYGDVLLKAGKKKEALEAFEKALHFYSEGEMWDNALAVGKKMLRFRKDPHLELRLAEIYSYLGKPDETLEILEKLVPMSGKEITFEEMGTVLEKVASGIAADSEIWPRFQRLFARLVELVEAFGERTLKGAT